MRTKPWLPLVPAAQVGHVCEALNALTLAPTSIGCTLLTALCGSNIFCAVTSYIVTEYKICLELFCVGLNISYC